MCFYDRTHHCQDTRHTLWSGVRLFCKDAVGSKKECGAKRVHKFVFRGWPCPQCDPLSDQSSRPLSSQRYPVVVPRQKPLAELPCEDADCMLLVGHDLPHQIWVPCPTDGCYLAARHDGPHQERHYYWGDRDSRIRSIRSEEIQKQQEQEFRLLNLLVLGAMGVSLRPDNFAQIFSSPVASSISTQHNVQNQAPHVTLKQRLEDKNAANMAPRRRATVSKAVLTQPDQLYLDLDLQRREIRLFKLFPKKNKGDIQGTFYPVRLSESPPYTALSYTWGDPTDTRKIAVDTVEGTETLDVRKNLWEFLRRQSSQISEPKLLWIDALCINQSNVHERNHQVNLMKDIYTKAAEVYIWLGTESANSNIAMEYIKRKGTRSLRPRGPGYHRIWTREEGRALHDLCERPYWRRMWVIQEIVHAQNITVWCGAKSFTWDVVESLYLMLKTLEDTHWFPHHELAIQVLQSSAAVMIWQRAHWRHPETPTPSLRTLIEVFRDWQCSDIRDKVFALVSMASSDTKIVPDYALPARDVYFAVRNRRLEEGWRFENMLSQILGLSDKEVNLASRDLIEYKVHPPDRFILSKRINDDW